MRFFRRERIISLIKNELSKIIIREFDFEGALVTITDIELNKKLDQAKIGISVIPPEKGDKILKEIKKNQGELQWQLLKKINIKPTPRISFFIDHGPENSANIEKLILDE